ncbi:hypothetical protein ACTXT7_000769 [Hymenolepis weldensis]
MPILQRMSLSSRLAYTRSRCQNCNENGHKGDFCLRVYYEQFNEAEPNNKRPLTQTRRLSISQIAGGPLM